MRTADNWLGQEAKFWEGDSAELHALMKDLGPDIEAALLRQAEPVSEDQIIRAGVAFIMGGERK